MTVSSLDTVEEHLTRIFHFKRNPVRSEESRHCTGDITQLTKRLYSTEEALDHYQHCIN